MQVPDAVYHLMRHTELKSCDLSGNVITKISPKFAVKFNLISGMMMTNVIPHKHELKQNDICRAELIAQPNGKTSR